MAKFGTTLQDWLPTASPEAREHAQNLVSMYSAVLALQREIGIIEAPYVEAARKTRSRWGFDFSQLADLVVEQEIAPCARNALGVLPAQLELAQRELTAAFVKGVEEYDLSCLGLFQRNYFRIVGRPLPDLKQTS